MKSSWWTPGGITIIDTSPIKDLPDNNHPLARWLESRGWYKLSDTSDDEYASYYLEYRAWRHDEKGIAMIEVFNGDWVLSTVFIDRDYQDAFFMTEWPRMLAQRAETALPEPLDKLTKLFVAFVRHGHGTEVVGEYGDIFPEE